MTDNQTDPFSVDVVGAITGHMNRDHGEDSLLICRVTGGVPEAESARVGGLDADGVDFVATVDGREVPVRLGWSRRLTERGQVRAELVRMVDVARNGQVGSEESQTRH